jgi:hypothetical protein
MDSIIRNVRDIDSGDRLALEHVIGTHLTENQQVVIQVLNVEAQPTEKKESREFNPQSGKLPEWCNVYEGLGDAEIADIESSIVRSHNSRSFG